MAIMCRPSVVEVDESDEEEQEVAPLQIKAAPMAVKAYIYV